MDQIPMDEIKKHFLPLAHKYLSKDYQIFIFGSRAAGTAHPTSDIDIGIKGTKPVPRHILARLREDLKETRLLYKTDIVDLMTAGGNLRRLAMKDAKLLQL